MQKNQPEANSALRGDVPIRLDPENIIDAVRVGSGPIVYKLIDGEVYMELWEGDKPFYLHVKKTRDFCIKLMEDTKHQYHHV